MTLYKQTIAWDPSSTPAACVKEYVVTTYMSGSQTPIKTTTVPAPKTSFYDNIYVAGKQQQQELWARVLLRCFGVA